VVLGILEWAFTSRKKVEEEGEMIMMSIKAAASHHLIFHMDESTSLRRPD
jgi:hypothetical protein